MRSSVLAILILLTGCGSIQMDRVATTAAATCRRAEPLLEIASHFPIPEVYVIVLAVGALCVPLTAGIVPNTLDANTPRWLDENLAGILRNLPR